jgi:hypothetical protein
MAAEPKCGRNITKELATLCNNLGLSALFQGVAFRNRNLLVAVNNLDTLALDF